MEISKNVLIDPSLILAQWSMNNTFELIQKLTDSNFQFYIQSSIKDTIESQSQNNENPAYKFFLHNAQSSDFSLLSDMLDQYSEFYKYFAPTNNQIEKNISFLYALEQMEPFPWDIYYDKYVAKMLFEEFIFLQEYSSIVARTKKTFNKIIDAGAVCLQVGRKTFYELCKKSIKKQEDEFVTNIEMLRAFGKWIAVGGPPTVGLFEPILGYFGGLIGGYFLLIDP
jgi:hypothetical protein